MSKKSTVTFADEEMLMGAKNMARHEGKTFSQYVTELIGKDLESKMKHKIVAHYKSGEVKEETHFYSTHDLYESVNAYLYILENNVKCGADQDELAGFEVYKNGKLYLIKGVC